MMFPQQDADNLDTENIQFFAEEIDFELPDENSVRKWILEIIQNEGQSLEALTFVFCSDEYLHQMNVEYLDHDTLTDVITFPYAEPPQIEGDIFISIDRIEENAKTFEVPFLKELHRVIIHGVFHLCGYGDKTPEEEKLMREKEDYALKIKG